MPQVNAVPPSLRPDLTESTAKGQRLDSSSAAEADVLPTDPGADTLTRADIPRIVDAAYRIPPQYRMPIDDAQEDLEQESLADDPVDPPLGKW